jgi:hypothetical protein
MKTLRKICRLKRKKRSKREKRSKRKRCGGNPLSAQQEPDINPDLVVGPLPPPGTYFGYRIDYFSNVFAVSSSVKNETIIEAFNRLLYENCVLKIVKRGNLKLVTVNITPQRFYPMAYQKFIEIIHNLQQGIKIRIYKIAGTWLYDARQIDADGRPIYTDDVLTFDPAHPETFYAKLFVAF